MTIMQQIIDSFMRSSRSRLSWLRCSGMSVIAETEKIAGVSPDTGRGGETECLRVTQHRMEGQETDEMTSLQSLLLSNLL